MGKVTGFLEYTRELPQRRPVTERVNDWFEIYRAFPEENIRQQGALHGLRRALLPQRMSVNNIIPGGTTISAPLEEAVRVLHPPTISPSSPDASAHAVRSRPCARHQ
jgi:hypothetical protein